MYDIMWTLLVAALVSTIAASEVYRCPANLLGQNNKLDTYGDNCYQYIHDFVSWDSAKSKCQQNGGHLVVITSSGINDFIVQMVKGFENPNKIWIGAHDKDSSEGTWNWVNGAGWGYSPWAVGFPTYWFYPPCPEDCAMLKTTTKKWEDNDCADTVSYVCQYGLGPTTTTMSTTTSVPTTTTSVPTTTTTVPTTTTTVPTTTTTLPTTTTTVPTTTTTVPTTSTTVPKTTTTLPITTTVPTSTTASLKTSTSNVMSTTTSQLTTTAVTTSTESEDDVGSVGALKDKEKPVSEGTWAAIIVCILFFIVALIIIVALLYRQRRLKRKLAEDEPGVRFDNVGYTGVNINRVQPGNNMNNSQHVNGVYDNVTEPSTNHNRKNTNLDYSNEKEDPYHTLEGDEDENPYKTLGAEGKDSEYDSIPADKLQDLENVESEYLTPVKKADTLKYDNVDQLHAENLYTELPHNENKNEHLENISNRSTEELLESFRKSDLQKTPLTFYNNVFKKEDEKDKGSDI